MPDESLLRITVFTVLVAAAATVVMLPIGVGLAWLLARRRFRAKALLDTLVTVPLVMPPVATGLILLRLLGARGPLGRALEAVGLEIVFTWKAVLLAMAVMGLPLVVRTVRAGLQQVNPRYEQMAETLGAGPLRVFFTITLPLASRSVVAGAILGFSRALGEFGATIMIAGSIPGRTRTLASAIYVYAETGRDAQAATLVAIAIVVAFVAVWLSNRITDRDSGLGIRDSSI
jgi:molybdate transport system permease protein